jgi:hypothetical protein
MKITFLTPALVAILGLALASVPVTAQAQTSTNAAPSAPAKVKSTKPTEYRGSITAIDASSVTVASSKKTLTLAIAATTTFLKDGKTATLADFAVCDKVSGSYTKDATGAMTAYSLHKKTPKAAATKPAAAPAAAAPATQ